MINMIKKVVFLTLILIIAADVFNSSLAFAARRVALVIGNSDYKVSPLKNPVNDARDMQKVLKQVGFDVIIRTNANYEQMLKAIDEFAGKLKHSEVGLFFYAGHGMQINGDNYLIPTRAHITSETDVKYSAVNAGRVLGKMEGAGNLMNIVILDACRDNPFKRSFRTSQKGLARMDAPVGSIVAYATAPGSVAADGSGRNGIYTKNLIKNITQKGVSLNDVFMEVRKGVLSDTGGKQVPWEESSLIGKFYFAMGTQLPPVNNNKSSMPDANIQQVVSSPASPVHGDAYTDPVTGMEFVWVKGGCYQMGQIEAGKQLIIKKMGEKYYNKYYKDELPQHEVCVDGFWIGKYEVTQSQWQKIMGNNPSSFKSVNDYPVETVSWDDAKNFIARLNKQSGNTFKLPTEAQWEYASRSQNSGCLYSGGNNIDSVAWYSSNSGSKTHRIGTKTPNAFGIYDMSGNVWEWCEDVYDENAYSKHSRNNPLITSGSSFRVIRGGSWSRTPAYVRSADRGWYTPGFTHDDRIGFRLCSAQVRQ